MSLQLIHIPSKWPHFPTYALAAAIQTKLQQKLLAYKASLSTPIQLPPPPPTLLSFTPAPTYTFGRRQTTPLCAADGERLCAPLRVWRGAEVAKYNGGTTNSGESRVFRPEIIYAPRGGLATYHGPSQLVFWPVIDLHSPLHRHLTVRDYACLLEKTTIAVLQRCGIEGFTTDNPGVWVGPKDGKGKDERKIAALGVHLRRHITGLGTAVNLSMPVSGPEAQNPWGRIVACGLEGKRVTTLRDEMRLHCGHQDHHTHDGSDLDFVLSHWTREFATRLLGAPDIKTCQAHDLLGENWDEELGLDEVDRYAVGDEVPGEPSDVSS